MSVEAVATGPLGALSHDELGVIEYDVLDTMSAEGPGNPASREAMRTVRNAVDRRYPHTVTRPLCRPPTGVSNPLRTALFR